MSIIIKKVSEDITYYEKATTSLFEVNGKQVHVSYWTKEDPEMGIYDSDTVIKDDDLAELTDLEHEALGEDLSSRLDLKEGESITINDN